MRVISIFLRISDIIKIKVFMKVRCFLVICFFLLRLTSIAEMRVSLGGILDGDVVDLNGEIGPGSDAVDSIIVILKRDCIVNVIDRYTEVVKVIPDANNRFSFKFRLGSKRIGKIFQLVIYGKNWHEVINDYLIEPGDNVKIGLVRVNSTLKLKFEGYGSDKYTCRRRIEISSSESIKRFLQVTSQTDDGSYNLIDIPVHFKHYTNRQNEILGILLEYKQKISLLTSQIMEADAISRVHDAWIREIYNFFQNTNNKSKKADVIEFSKDYDFIPKEYPSEVISLSYKYVDYLLRRNQTKLYFEHKGNNYEFKDLYILVKNNFIGDLRDRLFVLLFVSPSFKRPEMLERSADYDECALDANNIIQLDLAKNVLNRVVQVYAKGTPAFAFALPDSTDKVFELTDFHGKGVLLDIWYTGCLPCAYFAKRLEKEVYPFVNRDSSVFASISVSTDKSRSRWIKSLKTGIYTSPENLNLYTGGLGTEHPIMKYYDIIGFPFVLLIGKDGRVYSRLSSEMNNSDLIELINTCVSENN